MAFKSDWIEMINTTKLDLTYKIDLKRFICDNLINRPLGPVMFAALEKELAFEYLEQAGLTDKLDQNIIWVLCKKFALFNSKMFQKLKFDFEIFFELSILINYHIIF